MFSFLGFVVMLGGGMVTSTAGAQTATTPAEILRDVQAIGARATLNALYRNDEQWATVLRGIASGTPQWIDVAEALRRASDAHSSDALDGAVAEALGTNARSVLSRATGPFVLSAICGAPDLHDERFDTLREALAELNRRIRGVERVQDPLLAALRKDCLDSLRASEPDLRHYFGSPGS